MKILLLSGGAGKRLWPLSNTTRSKQFLKLLKSPDGKRESMIQRVWRQLEETNLMQKAYLATNQSQLDVINSQLNKKARLIIEPERRDTFPAILLSAAYMHSVENVSRDEVICVIPVDPFVDQTFFEHLQQLEHVLHQTEADLALIGVKPTDPSEKFGYIVPQTNGKSTYKKVDFFVEKPTQQRAKKLIKKQALWNCGVFAFRLGFLLDLMNDRKFPLHYHELVNVYDSLPKTSFDYEVVEKTNNIVALPYEGLWKDLGTWDIFTGEMDDHVIGTGILSKTENAHLINELNIPTIIHGLSDIVLVASPDGILVTDKKQSSTIKESIQRLQNRPMFEEKRWGCYHVIDYKTLNGGNQSLTKSISVRSGENISYKTHEKRSEVWTMISGEGLFVLNDRIQHVTSGDVLQIPKGAKHAIKAITDIQFIEVQLGADLNEEDSECICLTWAEIEKRCTPK